MGRFSLVKIKNRPENQWLLIKAEDEFVSSENIAETRPDSVLSDKTITFKNNSIRAARNSRICSRGEPKEFPTSINPMLAVPVDEPFENEDWVYEVKWDGVRAILFWNKSDAILKITSRKGNEISQRYPEIMTAIDSYIHCNNSVVLDGEIVVLDKEGVPDFQRHQSRMNVDD